MFLDHALVALDDAAFEEESRQRIERLRQASSLEDARRLYQEQVLPCEAARMRRAAQQRTRQGQPEFALLFVTVGAQASSPALAILASPARFVVLLHTREAAAAAHEVVEVLGLSATQARLVDIGDGKNPNILYRICFDEWQRQGRPARVGFDITGGLKTMSAALAVAGFALPGARVFYIDAGQTSLHRQTFWIDERRIELDNPLEVFGEVRRVAARDLLRQGRYGPAAAAYGELARYTDQEADLLRAELARGYHDLECLAFEQAAATLEVLAARLDRRAKDSPALHDDPLVVHRERVRANAEGARKLVSFTQFTREGTDPVHERRALAADECRDFIAMLVAAAERRRREGQLDVAALLAYRASEAVVQRRLVLRGDIDPSDPDWSSLAQKAGLSEEELLTRYGDIIAGKRDTRPAELPRSLGRAEAYGVLAVAFPDDIADGKDYAGFNGPGKARNRNLLAHGVARIREKDLNSLCAGSKSLLARMLDMEKLEQAERAALYARHEFLEVTGDHVARTEVAP